MGIVRGALSRYPDITIGSMAVRNDYTNQMVFSGGMVSADNTLLPLVAETNLFKVTGLVGEITTKGMITVDSGLRIDIPGVWVFDGWANVRHSANNATVGFVFAIRRGGVIVSVTDSPVLNKMPNGNDPGLISGIGATKPMTLQAGDILEVFAGTDTAGTLTVPNCNVIGMLVSAD